MYLQRNKIINKNTGKEYTSVFLCSKYREGGKIKTRTEANLSHLPELIVLSIENVLKSDQEATICLKEISINKCIDYGYIFVLLHIIKRLRIDQVLKKTLSESDVPLVIAMLVGKIVTGGSKLCIFNWLCREHAISELLGLDMSKHKVDHLYSSLGMLWMQQSKIEKKWFHYHQGNLRRVYLYDITSTYFEGVQNALAAYGYNRDGKRGKMQMCIGLLTTENGFPLRIQAFAGNTSDSVTVPEQLRILKEELGVEEIVFVGDRGMHIIYHLENDTELAEKNINFITGLTRTQIDTLIAQDALQLNMFSKDFSEISIEDKRYILSVNPDLEKEEVAWLENHKERCDDLLNELNKKWANRCEKNEENRKKQANSQGTGKYKNLKTELTTKDIDGYKRRVEQVIESCAMNKYYSIETIDNQMFSVQFDQQQYDNSHSLCGKYVVCTNVCAQKMNTEQVRGEYKKLQNVEHAFRDMKSDNISIRPVYHCNENQTRGHVLLCMFAYAIIKELEDKLFPFLKEYNKTHKTKLAFNDMIAELNNIKMCELKLGKGVTSIQYPELNPLQKKMFELLGIDPKKMAL
jgi:transposase